MNSTSKLPSTRKAWLCGAGLVLGLTLTAFGDGKRPEYGADETVGGLPLVAAGGWQAGASLDDRPLFVLQGTQADILASIESIWTPGQITVEDLGDGRVEMEFDANVNVALLETNLLNGKVRFGVKASETAPMQTVLFDSGAITSPTTVAADTTFDLPFVRMVQMDLLDETLSVYSQTPGFGRHLVTLERGTGVLHVSVIR